MYNQTIKSILLLTLFLSTFSTTRVLAAKGNSFPVSELESQDYTLIARYNDERGPNRSRLESGLLCRKRTNKKCVEIIGILINHENATFVETTDPQLELGKVSVPASDLRNDSREVYGISSTFGLSSEVNSAMNSAVVPDLVGAVIFVPAILVDLCILPVQKLIGLSDIAIQDTKIKIMTNRMESFVTYGEVHHKGVSIRYANNAPQMAP